MNESNIRPTQQEIIIMSDIRDRAEKFGVPYAQGWGYEVKPEGKTLYQCWSHGADHRAYRWAPHPDSRWTDGQVAAYCLGYRGIAFDEKKILGMT